MRYGTISVLAVLIFCGMTPASHAGGQHLTRARMKAVVLRDVDFREIRFSDAVAFLKQESKEQDPQEKGINLILKLDPNQDPQITMKLGKKSMYDVLTLISDVAGYQWRFIGGTLILEPKPDPKEK